jgi:TRAP-type uncharacterized transport system fused permease subunit
MIIITYSGGNPILSLVLTMLITIILGMGLPTTAAYAISASMLAPALTKLGMQPIASHLFIFYFSCLSSITPPVCVAAYAAAAIAKARPWSVGWEATKFASAGFIIPFMFAYGNELLFKGSPLAIGIAIISAIFGIAMLSGSVQGWFFGVEDLNYFERALLLSGALLLLKPGLVTDTIGVLIIAGILIGKYLSSQRNVKGEISNK